ncbi:FAD-binding oxidoreductase [Pseudomonas putida]
MSSTVIYKQRHSEAQAHPEQRVLDVLKSKLDLNTTAEIRFDAASKAMYASEASNYRQPPIGVVVPKTLDDLVNAVKFFAEADLPILPRGAGTSVCGQSVNAAVIIDASKYLNRAAAGCKRSRQC